MGDRSRAGLVSKVDNETRLPCFNLLVSKDDDEGLISRRSRAEDRQREQRDRSASKADSGTYGSIFFFDRLMPKIGNETKLSCSCPHVSED